jgi:plasmid stabilization system protein ParE
MEIQWLDNAREDIISLYGWYAKENLTAVVKLYRSIIEDVGRLAFNPYIGHPEELLEGLEYEFRTLLCNSRNHRIIYFIDEDTVFISRIWDCRRRPSKLRQGILKKK